MCVCELAMHEQGVKWKISEWKIHIRTGKSISKCARHCKTECFVCSVQQTASHSGFPICISFEFFLLLLCLVPFFFSLYIFFLVCGMTRFCFAAFPFGMCAFSFCAAWSWKFGSRLNHCSLRPCRLHFFLFSWCCCLTKQKCWWHTHTQCILYDKNVHFVVVPHLSIQLLKFYMHFATATHFLMFGIRY